MDHDAMTAHAKRTFAAWNRQDIDEVLACYTEDLVYSDPNTRGPVKGAAAMRRYLSTLFDRWTMTWTLKETRPFEGRDGCAVRWHGVLRRPGEDRAFEIDGMDFVELENGRIKRNEVYFDRAALRAPAALG